MSRRKGLAVFVCIAVLGAQLWASVPISLTTSGWYWPFLPYPMYARAYARSDSLIVPELRATTCGSADVSTLVSPDDLGVPRLQLSAYLTAIARNPDASAGLHASARISRAIDAQFPGRFCAASVWTRVAYVADTATHHVRGPMGRRAEWKIAALGHR